MTRTAAREVAVNLIFAAAASPELTPEELLDNFFDPEHYKTLSGESERFTEYPNEKQMQYIRAMVAGVCTHRDELNEYIRKYARGWKLERISRVAAALLRCAMIAFMEVAAFHIGTYVMYLATVHPLLILFTAVTHLQKEEL